MHEMKEGTAGKISNILKDWAEVATRQLQLGGVPSGMETDLALALIDANPSLFDPLLARVVQERPLPPPDKRIFTRAPGDTAEEVLTWLRDAPLREAAERERMMNDLVLERRRQGSFNLKIRSKRLL